MFAMFLYLTLYIQNILGYSALESGLRFMPVTLLSFLVAPVSGKFAERLGVRWFLGGGLALVGLGLLLMHGIKQGDGWTALLPGFMIAGIGIGLVNPALATAAIGVVEPRRAGMASGINSTFRQVGVATGIAVWGALFQHRVESAFTSQAASAGLHGRPPGAGSLADFVAFGGARRSGNPQLSRLAESAFDAGLNHILLVAAILAFAGAAISVVLVRPADFARGREAGAAAEAVAA
jgi:MFS family permease